MDDENRLEQLSDGAGTAEAATKVLAATARAEFADACEFAAIASQDMYEQAQALESLTRVAPATTAMLTEATRSGATQELPSARPAPELSSSVEPEEGRSAAGSGTHAHRRLLAIIAVCACCVMAAVAFLIWFASSSFTRPDDAAVERVLAADTDIMDGFASNDYVEPTDYALSDVEISSCEKAEDGSFVVDASATLTNESFESGVTAKLVFARASERDRYPALRYASPDASGWVGAVIEVSADTRAIAGVNVDRSFADDFDATFDAASQTSTFTAQETYEFWFGSATVSTLYTYTFDGTAWTRSAGEPTSEVSYDADALAGEYSSADSASSSLRSFTISHVDSAAGTFTLEYRAQAPGFMNSDVTGVITCTLERVEPTDVQGSFRQIDGRVYTFAGEGTSSGGAGTSRIEGALGLDGSIVFTLSADYTHTPLFFGEPAQESMEVAGTLAHR